MINIQNNIKYLHIIRGFAAFFVVLAHAKWPFWIGGAAYLEENSFWSLSILNKIAVTFALMSSNGTAMVIIFFVLSGFMISYSYKKNNWSYRHFLQNRILRIYIPYGASMLFAGVILYFISLYASDVFLGNNRDYNSSIAKAIESGLTLKNFFATVFFYRTDVNYYGFNYVYWSLLYEVIFYLFFPIIFKHVNKIAIGAILIHPLQYFINLPEMPYFYLWFFVRFLLYFVAGVWFFHNINRIENFKINFILSSKLLLSLVLVCLFLGGIFISGFLFHKSISFLFAVIFTLCWIYYILKHGVPNNILTRFFVFTGTISYSLYLIHVPILLLFYSINYYFFKLVVYPSPWVYLPYSFLTLPFAYIFYLVFEKLSLKFIERHKRAIKPINN